MDGWKDHYIAQCRVLVLQNVFRKMEFVPNGILGGYCHGTGVVQSTRRVLPRSWKMVMCD
jgi:hypothetical protein